MAKRRLWKTLSLFAALALSSCAIDLGNFEKSDGYQDLYDSLGEVRGLFDGGNYSYKVENSLFNADTVQKMSWKKSEYEVEEEQYLYLIVPFKKALKIESIGLCFRSPVYSEIEVSFFYFINEDAAPKKIKYLSSPDTKPIYDDDGNVIGEEPIEYDDPPVENSILRGKTSLATKEWGKFAFGGFKQEGYDDGCLHTGQDGLLYLRIENNSGWNKDRLLPSSVTFINLLIRAI